ncbi:nuclease EXOG, mitochondrial-like [Dendrobates tinctorius]|uniref:nuclease EXOG, mitochondrial-like n=1 Tax=Dendrobates tinctorius TaxID=92724 RepID=UPI003CC9D025
MSLVARLGFYCKSSAVLFPASRWRLRFIRLLHLLEDVRTYFLQDYKPPLSGGFRAGGYTEHIVLLAALYLYERKRAEPEPIQKSPLEEFGFPQSGEEVRQHIGHALSYDQAKKTPRWVIEHLTKEKIVGVADRKHCRFKPDPNIPQLFSASNEDYLRSGWSRGHMAPAGDSKYSIEAMAETFYLSNIVPQNYKNNAGFWNRSRRTVSGASDTDM